MGKMDHDILTDDFGKVHVWLLPYIRPSYVNRYLDEDDRVGSYQQAVARAIAMSDVDFSKRNVIVSHQFVTGAKVDPLGSEQLIVGGLDQISASVYDGFDFGIRPYSSSPAAWQKCVLCRYTACVFLCRGKPAESAWLC